MVNNSDLLPLIDRLKTARVLCIGDVMLDHYIYGQVERVSPEAPIPVLWIEREMKNLGGAGNVMRNLRGVGAASLFFSAVGNDAVHRRQSAALAGRSRERDPARPLYPRGFAAARLRACSGPSRGHHL